MTILIFIKTIKKPYDGKPYKVKLPDFFPIHTSYDVYILINLKYTKLLSNPIENGVIMYKRTTQVPFFVLLKFVNIILQIHV